MKKAKLLIVVGCLLGFALAWIPAYASPTSKKITITCTSVTPYTFGRFGVRQVVPLGKFLSRSIGGRCRGDSCLRSEPC